MVETGQVSEDELAELEQYLGPSTLAKLQGMEDEEGATEGAAAATEADAAEMSTDAVEAEQQPAEAEAPLVDGVEEAEQTESTEQTDAEPVGEEG